MPSLAASIEQSFGRRPHWIARAPGRVNLIGEHTDYNDGLVLPMAIERDVIIVAAPNESSTVTWRTTAGQHLGHVDLSRPIKPLSSGDWLNYPRGVLAGFMETGFVFPGFDALVYSTVPIGGGLSSSAALEVAVATLLETIVGEQLDPVRKALLCQVAEQDHAGVPCGIMDQFISVLGKKNNLLLLDCRSRTFEQIALTDPAVSVLIINSHVRHQLAGGEYAVRREQCKQAARKLQVNSLRDVTSAEIERARDSLDPVSFRRARHVVTEIVRTAKMAARVRERDWLDAGRLMYQSHESLRDDYEVSCPELDVIVECAGRIGVNGGVYGCRMTGGGFGGCAVALVESAGAPEITRTLTDEYVRRTGRMLSIFSSRPARGASVVRYDDLDFRDGGLL